MPVPLAVALLLVGLLAVALLAVVGCPFPVRSAGCNSLAAAVVAVAGNR